MSSTATLEEVLADADEQAQILRRSGYERHADSIAELVSAVRGAAREFLEFAPETEAMLFSGQTRNWLRDRFAGWERRGHAKKEKGMRYYRLCVLPRRAEPARAREAGRAAARQGAAS
jgi:hypothetical protein